MSDTKNVYQAIRAHVSGSYSKGELHGKEYIIVPVVALVEGVIQGMAAEGPELALAEEFGRYPDSWNGRPIVMSHPTIDGKPVSANSPSMLSEYQIGYIFNTKVQDNKLELEAWVDPDLMENLNEDSKETLEVLKAGTRIEVSTGYFAQIEPTPGFYANEAYDAVQRNVVPDHLAFLPQGVVGACSIADGAGAQLAINCKPTDQYKLIRTLTAGGKSEASMPSNNSSMDPSEDSKKDKKNKNPKAYEAQEPQTTIANTIAGGVTLEDVRKEVGVALRESSSEYPYILAMTKDMVIYEVYQNDGYATLQRSYSVSSDGSVTLGDTVEKVRLMTKVVAVNADGTVPEDNPERNMADENSGEAPVASAEPKVHKTSNDQGTLEVTVNEQGEPVNFTFTPKVNEVKRPSTVDEFVAQAPAEMQEILNASIKLHQDKKNTLVNDLLKTNRCKFTEGALKAMSLDMLENLASLADVQPSFEGVARPHVNASNDDSNVTPAPLVFEAK